MQKTYIFFVNTLSSIGGAQLYIKNKYNYLIENDWNVFIFAIKNEGFTITDFMEYKHHYVIPELEYFTNIFPIKNRSSVIDQIEKKILRNSKTNINSRIVIESHLISTSLWGELLAQKLQAKHFIYLLQESFGDLSISLLQFLDFKHKRLELAGIKEQSLSLLFKNYKNLNKSDKFNLPAVGTINLVENINNPIIDNLSRHEINIGCISRLDKEFIITMVDEIRIFAEHNRSKKILFLLIGDSKNNTIKKIIKKKLIKQTNINLVLTGFLFPIPKKVFDIIDIFISTAGSAKVCVQEGALTMTIDHKTHRPIGLLGIDTYSNTYSDLVSSQTINEMLDDLMLMDQQSLIRIKKKIDFKQPDLISEFDKHMKFINKSAEEKNYYNLSKIKLGLKGKIFKSILRIIDIERFEKLLKIYYKLLKLNILHR